MHAIARHEHGGDRFRTGGSHFFEEFAIGGAQRLLVEIARPGHFKAGDLVGLRHQRGVVGGCWKLRALVSVIADHERETRLRRWRLPLLRVARLKAGGDGRKERKRAPKFVHVRLRTKRPTVAWRNVNQ